MAKKADGSTAMAALIGYMVFKGVGDAMSPYLLGKPAEGDLKRPFKAGGMFGAASDPQTDKAAIDEAEKRVGKKEE